MLNKEAAYREGSFKKAQEHGITGKQASALFKLAFGENTGRVFNNFLTGGDGKASEDVAAIALNFKDPGNQEMATRAETGLQNFSNWGDKLKPWFKDRAIDYGIGAGGGGALAAGGGALGGGLLGKGLGHFAGYLAGGKTDQEREEKKRSWGNIGAGVGAIGGALGGGALAGLGGPLAGIWNTDRGMSELPSY